MYLLKKNKKKIKKKKVEKRKLGKKMYLLTSLKMHRSVQGRQPAHHQERRWHPGAGELLVMN